MRKRDCALALGAAMMLTIAIGASEALAKKGGGHGGPGWAGNSPPGWGRGEKVGWGNSAYPPGWAQGRGKKKGWRGRSVPPGWLR